ncbi:MAG: DUF5522 domain-containing protein [Sumerlaeia bacterium]
MKNPLPQDCTPTGLTPQDYYQEGGYIVFTEAFHRRRGYCCGHGCRHCPFDDRMPKYDEKDECHQNVGSDSTT